MYGVHWSLSDDHCGLHRSAEKQRVNPETFLSTTKSAGTFKSGAIGPEIFLKNCK